MGMNILAFSFPKLGGEWGRYKIQRLEKGKEIEEKSNNILHKFEVQVNNEILL